MRIGQALDALREGKKVKRSSSVMPILTLLEPWGGNKEYVPEIVEFGDDEEVVLESADLFAEDWEVA